MRVNGIPKNTKLEWQPRWNVPPTRVKSVAHFLALAAAVPAQERAPAQPSLYLLRKDEVVAGVDFVVRGVLTAEALHWFWPIDDLSDVGWNARMPRFTSAQDALLVSAKRHPAFACAVAVPVGVGLLVPRIDMASVTVRSFADYDFPEGTVQAWWEERLSEAPFSPPVLSRGSDERL